MSDRPINIFYTLNAAPRRRFILCALAAVLMLMAQSAVAAPAGSNRAVELYEKACTLQSKGDYYGAIESYREALLLNPTYADAWYNLARCSYNLDEFDLAVEYAQNAEKYARNLSSIQNLKGMALLSLGRLDDAREVFDAILKSYPNDVDARFGLAELDLFNGRLSSAQDKYLDALKRDSTNRKALLSLALVSAEMGRDDAAERYVSQALEFHSGEAEVHYLSAYLAAKRGDLDEAEKRARSAVLLKGDYDSAYKLLSEILYSQGRYDEVMDICDYRLSRSREATDAWYLKALSQRRMGRGEAAIDSFAMGLSISPQDEIMRSAMEQLMGELLDIEDPRRSVWSAYHLAKAREAGKNFEGPTERYEYQKALSVDPMNMDARQSFASLLERDGFYELYLEQLKFIKENGSSSKVSSASVQTSEDSPAAISLTATEKRNNDVMEALQTMLRDNLSHKWDVNAFYLNKTRWNIGIYYTASPVQSIHPDLEEITALAAGDIFNGVPAASVDVESRPVSGYGEAYRLARNAGRDYFLMLSVQETERSISLDATMYSARTGTVTSTIHAYRTGNDRFASVLRRFRQAVLETLPIRGKVLSSTQNLLLVDLGKSDGIVAGAVFDVVQKGRVQTADNGPGVVYSDRNVLGTFTVTRADEEICEGNFTKKGFYNILNAGDEVVLVSLPETKNSTNGNAVTDTRPAGNKEGEAASGEEVSSLAEELKVSARESVLLEMVRKIL